MIECSSATSRGASGHEFDGFHQPQGVRFDGDRLLVCDTVGGELVAVWRCPAVNVGCSPRGCGPRGTSLVLAGRPDRGRGGGPAPDRRGRPRGRRGRRCSPAAARRDCATGPRASAPRAAERARGNRRATRSPSPTRRCPRSGSSATAGWRRSSAPGSSTGAPPTAIARTARLQHPLGVAALPDGSIAVADTFNSLLRVWEDGALRTVPLSEPLDEPGGLDVLPDGRLVVADTNHHRVVTVDAHTGAVTEIRIGGRPKGEQSRGPPLSGARGRQARAQRGRRPRRARPRPPAGAARARQRERGSADAARSRAAIVGPGRTPRHASRCAWAARAAACSPSTSSHQRAKATSARSRRSTREHALTVS